ncbi:urea ABC transporter permease subunit UrtC [Halalkalibacter krulwichiae]|uniref:Leucine/isoleucine/valine transporter permease subunit n=1 Tax=Halalkalibacter krulwichiae TaxID=199441 RepID=A0A1X9MLK8_9BACI|nr:urea ABC transporter permease subunit UrtC [Halalkalibacter krulwichiae]ARK32771.1 leucine/isoleucine/valine transporter permease subunit [Halalkalibacter krulwichiae]
MAFSLSKYLFDRRWLFVALLIILVACPLFLSDFRLNLLGRFLAFAILVIGLDLLWGYTGVLSLGHGIFFGVGAYIMAIYLKLEATSGAVPDFMMWNGITELPWFWAMFENPVMAISFAILLPMLLAGTLGFFIFRNRIKDVYFTILTQALVIVTVTLIISKQEYTGGTNGITGFSTVFGQSLMAPSTQKSIYLITVLCLGLIFFLCYRLVHSRFGKTLIAIRDGENRLRFSGYDTSLFKVFVFALSAGIAGLAGMLFVLQVGMISPTTIGIVPSIEMILWVAIGGRGTLIGPVFGAITTNLAKTFFSENYPDIWLFFLGSIFVIVVLFLPGGFMSLFKKWRFKKKGGIIDETKSIEEAKRPAV